MVSKIRHHKVLEADVHRVITHLKLHGKITANDRITRPHTKKKKDGSTSEEIPWSQTTELLGSWQSKDLKAGPKGKLVLYAKENDVWKRGVPAEEVAKYVRAEMLSSESRMPLSRDNAYHYLQKSTVGISRRAAYKFLEKQTVLQMTKNIPNERKKGGIALTERGYCEMDLIEGKGRDLYKAFGARGDWYWLALVEVFTGYGVVATVRAKKPAVVAKALKELLDELEGAMHAKVTTIATDHGREFYTDVRKLLKTRNIAQKQVPRGSRVEKFNQDFQRHFYRILRLGRGTFGSLEEQAQDMTNELKSKHTKKTPKEALETPDEELAPGYKKGRETEQEFKGRKPEVGDKARVLVKLRKNIHPILKIGSQSRLYKSYHGRHFTKRVHTITQILTKNGTPRYFVNAKWRDRDQLLLVSGTDSETERQLAERNGK